MNRTCSKRRCSIIPSLLLLASFFSSPVAAADIALRGFDASYDLFQGGMHVAISKLSLRRTGDFWRWSTVTQARGIYKWFTDKQPYTETTFALDENEILLQEIVVADVENHRRRESASFDWINGKLRVLRKGKNKDLDISAEVYDYQSIHLLAAAMNRQQLENATIDFYRKGRLVKSRFVYSGRQQVSIKGRKLDANVYEHMVVRSNSKIKYYYDAQNPLLPLRIEKLESGKSPTILTLRKVDWTL